MDFYLIEKNFHLNIIHFFPPIYSFKIINYRDVNTLLFLLENEASGELKKIDIEYDSEKLKKKKIKAKNIDGKSPAKDK